MKTMTARIALRVFVAQLIVLAFLGIIARAIAQRELVAGFDETLRANVDALAFVTELESNGDYEFEPPPSARMGSSTGDSPALFLLLTQDGEVIAASSPEAERISRAITADTIREFRREGIPYRGLMTARNIQSEISGEPDASIRVFYANSRTGLDEAVARVTAALLAFGLIGALLSAVLAYAVARSGLVPLNKFAAEFDRLSPSTLQPPFAGAELPEELRKPASAFNRLVERLKTAFQRERDFSADAAHELRTPVAAMKVAVQAASRLPRNAEEDAVLLSDLEEETLRLEELCEKLLLASRQDPAQPESMPFEEWRDAVQNVCTTLAPLAREHGSDILVQIDDIASEAALQSSSFVTQRVMMNLMSNAILHSGDGVTIIVSASKDEDGIRLTVDDNGCGIPESAYDQLFERFYRVDASRSRRVGGAGLGLAISRELARSQGGDVELVEKDSPGCRFVWRIRCSAKPALATPVQLTTPK